MKRNTLPGIDPLMSPYQRQIIEDAPRSIFFYTSARRAGLIPNTQKARQWAVEKRGATHFDMFSFHRLNLDKKPCSYKVGDFYCVITTKNSQHIGSSHVLECIISALSFSFGLGDLSPCKLVCLGRHTLGLSLPARIFGIEHGSDILPYLYKLFCDRLSCFVYGAYPGEFDIKFVDRVDAENKKISSYIYAVPFLIGEAESFSVDFLENISRAPRAAPAVKCSQVIKDDVLRDLKMNARYQNSSRVKGGVSFQPNQLTALGALVAETPISDPDREFSAMKCARKLVSRIHARGIHEFCRRDALRAVSGTQCLNGKSGNGGGVEDALIILVAHGYIKVCPFPPIDFPCGRPSPWYVVNPGLYSNQDRIHAT